MRGLLLAGNITLLYLLQFDDKKCEKRESSLDLGCDHCGEDAKDL
jgi:hypothetical protein